MGWVAALGLMASISCYAHMFSPPLVPSRCSLCLQDSLWSQILAMTTHYPDCIAASFLGEAPVFRGRETVVTISIIIQMCIFSPLFPLLFTCFQRFCQGTFSCFDNFWKWKPLLKVESTFQTIWTQIPKAVSAFTLLLFSCFQMLWKRFCVIHQIHWIWMSFSCLLSLEMRANSQTFGYCFSIFGQGYSTIPSSALWILARYHLPHFVIPNLLAFYWSSAWLHFMD